MTDPALERLREQVAATDRDILELVNRRLELVGEIRRHKDAHAVVFLDPGQEERLLARLRELNGGPLSSEGVERLFREILALLKAESGDELGRRGAEAPD
jgi:chorismate mutase/prephenate dehydratase